MRVQAEKIAVESPVVRLTVELTSRERDILIEFFGELSAAQWTDILNATNLSPVATRSELGDLDMGYAFYVALFQSRKTT